MAVEPVALHVRGREVAAVRVGHGRDLEAAVRQLALPRSPVLVLVGGASDMAGDDAARIGVALSEAIAPVVERLGAAIVDGGTRVGVMKLAGDARSRPGGDFALVGVVPEALVADVDLDERHTHFILVPGTRWGDESELLAAVATTVAAGRPTVTVLANGGDIAWEDAARSLELGRRVVVLAGTGRAADELAAGQTPRARALRATGLVDVVSIDRVDEAAATVARALTP